MTRVCANCGTEVDDEALFCPTCGQPIEAGAQPDLPPAPDWPNSGGHYPASDADAVPADSAAPQSTTTSTAPPAAQDVPEEPTVGDPYQPDTYVPPWRRERPSEPPADAAIGYAADDRTDSMTAGAYLGGAPVPPSAPPAAAPISPAPPRPGTARPPTGSSPGYVETPATLSGWLVGIGALVAVVALFLPWYSFGNYTAVWGFASGVNILVTVVLLAVLAAIFLAHVLPDIPRRELAFAAVGLLGIGIGLDRMGLGGTGIGVLLFVLGTLAIAAGGFVNLLGLDRPLGETRS